MPVTGSPGRNRISAGNSAPGKLKSWKPDVLLGLAAATISDFQDSRISPYHRPRRGRPCRVPRAVGQAVFFIASLMASDAQLDALCRVAVDRCEYLSVTLLVECPNICCTS